MNWNLKSFRRISRCKRVHSMCIIWFLRIWRIVRLRWFGVHAGHWRTVMRASASSKTESRFFRRQRFSIFRRRAWIFGWNIKVCSGWMFSRIRGYMRHIFAVWFGRSWKCEWFLISTESISAIVRLRAAGSRMEGEDILFMSVAIGAFASNESIK